MSNKHRPSWMYAFEARNPSNMMADNELRARNAFNRDFGTIVHSNFFKRLAHKTQVYSLPYNDHIHTRLTHSVEASQIGREIARYFCRSVLRKMTSEPLFADPKNLELLEREIEELTGASCLAHDIGHSPFAHVGKKTIEKFCDLKKESHKFDDNKQVVRILLNTNWFEKIKVSGPFVASVLKKNKLEKNCYASEEKKLKDILEKLNLTESRHPCSLFMEAADDIAYLSADLLDFVSIYSGANSFKEPKKFELFASLLLVDASGKTLNTNLMGSFNNAIENKSDEIKQDFSDNFIRVAIAHVFACIDNFSNLFLAGQLSVGSPTIENLPTALTRFLEEHASDHDGKKDINLLYSKCTGSAGPVFFELKEKIYEGAILTEEFIQEQDKLAEVVINGILSELYSLIAADKLDADRVFKLLPEDAQNYLIIAKENNFLFQGIVDLVSGMTDRYAVAFWKDVSGLGALERMSAKPYKKTA